MTVKVLSCTESNLLVGVMYVHAGVYVCVKVSDCISVCVCVCVCVRACVRVRVCVSVCVYVSESRCTCTVCILTEVSQHGHDYPPAETNYKIFCTIWEQGGHL